MLQMLRGRCRARRRAATGRIYIASDRDPHALVLDLHRLERRDFLALLALRIGLLLVVVVLVVVVAGIVRVVVVAAVAAVAVAAVAAVAPAEDAADVALELKPNLTEPVLVLVPRSILETRVRDAPRGRSWNGRGVGEYVCDFVSREGRGRRKSRVFWRVW